MNPQLCDHFEPGSVRWEPGVTRIVDPKIDGMRAIFINEDGEWRCCSRTGNPLYNVEHIIEELQGNPNLTDCVLDGELFAGTFKKTVSICRTQKKRKDAGQVHFLAFDYIDLAEWDTDMFVTPQLARKHALVLATHSMTKVIPIKGWMAKSDDDLERLYGDAVAMGFEGVIIKNPERPYARGRTTAWLKMKPTETDEFEIVDFEEGQSRLENCLGAIVVDSGGEQTSEVGTGFTDAEREWIWQNQKALIGLFVEIEFQGRGDLGRLRFPRFRGIRESRGGDYIKLNGELVSA